jgi:hypothetical protein
LVRHVLTASGSDIVSCAGWEYCCAGYAGALGYCDWAGCAFQVEPSQYRCWLALDGSGYQPGWGVEGVVTGILRIG